MSTLALTPALHVGIARRPHRLGLAALLSATMLAGCAATHKPPVISYDDARPAVLQKDPPAPIRVVALPKPLPLPGQLKPVTGAKAKPQAEDPEQRVKNANAAARIQPVRDGFINAMQVYPFTTGALYQVYAAIGEVTDIALQPGETLVGTGPVAAGDTARWIIGDTESGSGASKQIHILLKPTRPDLTTNLVINTDRRTYHLELHSTETTYMPDDKPVKVTVELPAAVHRDLTAYANAMARESGQPAASPEKLIAPMLQRFMATDRAFGRLKKNRRPPS